MSIQLILNKSNKNIIKILGNKTEYVRDYIASITENDAYLCQNLLNQLSNNNNLTWDDVDNKYFHYAEPITFYRNTPDCSIQPDWWKNIYKIKFDKLQSCNLGSLKKDGVYLSSINQLINNVPLVEKQAKKPDIFTTRFKFTKLINKKETITTKMEMVNILKPYFHYRKYSINYKVVIKNIIKVFKLIKTIPTKRVHYYGAEYVYNEVMHAINAYNNKWKYAYKLKIALDKLVIKYFPITNKQTQNVINKLSTHQFSPNKWGAFIHNNEQRLSYIKLIPFNALELYQQKIIITATRECINKRELLKFSEQQHKEFIYYFDLKQSFMVEANISINNPSKEFCKRIQKKYKELKPETILGTLKAININVKDFPKNPLTKTLRKYSI